MKVLQMNVVYGTGSTGKIVKELHNGFMNNSIDSIVLYGRGESISDPKIIHCCNNTYAKMNNVISRFTGYKYGGCYYSTKHIEKLIKEYKPDIVHLQCINGYFINVYKIVKWLNDNNIPTVITLHAEFMFTANCDHSFECNKWRKGCGQCPHLKKATKSLILDRTAQSFNLMYSSFKNFNKISIISVSPWLMERAKSSLMFSNFYHNTVLNGVDNNIFKPSIDTNVYGEYGDDIKKIFHVTALFSDDINHPKGGSYIIKLAKKNTQYHYFIAGKNDIHSQLPSNIHLLGEIKDQTLLAQYYSQADLTIITSKAETFSMVCAESLCCGTPVVGFKAGGPETISIPEYSQFVEYGNIDALMNKVQEWCQKEKYNNDEISKQARKKYSNEVMVQNYIQEYRRLLWN